jgi:type I restriction enzyme S subunit
VARLRELILTLAVQGKLVPQDPSDESASDLLQRVAANAIVRSAKSHKPSGGSDEIAAPYGLPDGWAWSRLGDIVENMGSGWSPACDEGERSDPTKWAVLRTTAVQVNEYRAREHKVIPSKLSPRPEIEVKDGDILIARAGPMNRVGISCWVNNTPPRLMLSDKIVRFHSIADEMLPAFVVLALNAGWTKAQSSKPKQAWRRVRSTSRKRIFVTFGCRFVARPNNPASSPASKNSCASATRSKPKANSNPRTTPNSSAPC